MFETVKTNVSQDPIFYSKAPKIAFLMILNSILEVFWEGFEPKRSI